MTKNVINLYNCGCADIDSSCCFCLGCVTCISCSSCDDCMDCINCERCYLCKYCKNVINGSRLVNISFNKPTDCKGLTQEQAEALMKQDK